MIAALDNARFAYHGVRWGHHGDDTSRRSAILAAWRTFLRCVPFPSVACWRMSRSVLLLFGLRPDRTICEFWVGLCPTASYGLTRGTKEETFSRQSRIILNVGRGCVVVRGPRRLK